MGNINSFTQGGTTYSYHYNVTNHLQQAILPTGTFNFTYDKRGNRLTKSSSTGNVNYGYNGFNQLKTLSKSGTNASYTYYGDGLRATKKVNTDFTRYVYFNGRVIDEFDEGFNLKARNIIGNELLFRQDMTNYDRGYYSYNGHGDVIKITDVYGDTLNSYDYDIWGNVIAKTETMSNPFKYSGEIYDDESDLIYLRARYYDPSIGRFITEDTYEGELNEPLSLNLYTYVGNNPLGYEDPTGHKRAVRPGLLPSSDAAGGGSIIKGSSSSGGNSGWSLFGKRKEGSPAKKPVKVKVDPHKTAHNNSDSLSKENLSQKQSNAKSKSNTLVKDTGYLAENTSNLRTWAKNNGWEQKYTDGGVEMWGVKNADGTFNWRLKLKPEVSTRDGLGVGSNQPRFDARIDDKGTYINPFTGQKGGRDVGTHIPLGK
ncbi:RHS repeat-associated core domain-containing protein [Paenibacillus sp. GSMTC-2017]|uniref:RHS repeat-associated core domain-containing protein n=1 Tax=Paenibacillus sp. GSMTC-2017 TaxID=2794350 RepID=UPI0018D6A214|nr:RHS repeat-associated core domain-containing protein [Paenibacillus sp. GSMTC-2017]MBH5318329.1 RHS repeat-associated core domain-containing protein [Paenibacillus sp. GSMTC-2017]